MKNLIKKIKKLFTKEKLIECPYHKGVFYAPSGYCEQCYIEEKNKE